MSKEDDDMLKDHVMRIAKDLTDGFDGELNEDGEEMTGFDYLNDALDINYTINSDRSYKGGRVLVAFGGPNIWIDTIHMEVQGYWWGSQASVPFRDNVGLDDALEELYSCQ